MVIITVCNYYISLRTVSRLVIYGNNTQYTMYYWFSAWFYHLTQPPRFVDARARKWAQIHRLFGNNRIRTITPIRWSLSKFSPPGLARRGSLFVMSPSTRGPLGSFRRYVHSDESNLASGGEGRERGRLGARENNFENWFTVGMWYT